ncbi:glycolate oxidase subunit GlcE [Denitromonas iodatirespirans]|uniref:Glycolate oxidase subunit GlcE n=1 Tax=Denitromonas iodatirespirans TaxID=2795389 RepID=A0A944HCY9_DENI1|nr:glycolate oxidase subunit GlcE [Denitromonas iodatirespirans]MBT0963202.1 glycolate oxidase subunit GlcE [Denitromonas iodatirespirans]
MTDIEQAWAGQIREAAAHKTPLRIRGGGTKDFYGQSLDGTVLDTRAHRGVISYEPTELVVKVRAGTPLAELEAALAAEGQMLGFEPPHFGDGATVGGCVAAGLSGPRRATAGAVRDFVLGVTLLDGRGERLHFGGEVMKNVAGYDVARLMTGSLGTLGLLLDVSIKVLPLPVAEATLRFEMGADEAVAQMNRWGGQPLPVSATSWIAGVLTLRLSGAEAAVVAACQRLGGERLDDERARAHWQGLREHSHGFFGGDAPLWRLSVPSVAGPIGLAGSQLIEWGGAQRWVRTEQDAASIRARAEALGGHATLFRAADKAAGVFQPLVPTLRGIHQRLKHSFDPAGIFSPGRLYEGL